MHRSVQVHSSCFLSRVLILIQRKKMVMSATIRIMRKVTVTPTKAAVSTHSELLRLLALITTSSFSSSLDRENWTSLGAKTWNRFSIIQYISKCELVGWGKSDS